jgi:serine/threonine protein kinase
MLNKQIQNYRIISLIGEGGMGDVYLAEHVSIKRKVAIKVLKPELVKNEEIRLRFKNEASMLAHLQHPNIVGLIDYVEQDGGLFLIMEYVEGRGLDEFIKAQQAPISIERAKKLMTQIVEAFAYAHKNGIIHRDVKPSNFIITSSEEIKVLDFGIAKLVGEGNHHLTKTGTQIGTVYYMSPEQVRGQVLDHRSDIYSLGVTFYELLTGVCPYRSMNTEYEIYDSIVKDPLLDLTQTMGKAYRTLWHIISKSTAKEVNDRYQSCIDFVTDIKKDIVDEPKVVKPIQKTEPVSAKTVQKEPRSRTWLIILISLVILGGGYFSWQQISQNETVNEEESNQIPADTLGGQVGNEVPDNTVDEPEPEIQEPFYPYGQVKNKVERYYSAVGSSVYDAWDFYAADILQFINWKNTNPDKLNENHQNNTEYVASEASVINDDIQFDRKENGIDYWTYWLDFSCYRTSKEMYQYCKIKVELGIDENFKFVSYRELKVTDLHFEDYR